MLPTLRQIEKLHKKYASTQDAYNSMYTLCKIVSDIAKQLALKNKLQLDMQLVEIGCMLHDIGVYRLYDNNGNLDESHYIKHGILGYEILKSEGYDEKLCRFASCHTGVGITAEQIIKDKLPLPPADFIANTAEERLVMFADKFHSKSVPPRFNTYESYKPKIAKFGPDKTLKFESMAREFGIPDLEALANTWKHEII